MKLPLLNAVSLAPPLLIGQAEWERDKMMYDTVSYFSQKSLHLL